MSYRTELRTLDALASRLPFHIDESNRINEAYDRYASGGRRSDRLLIDIWTYCYIRRYFLIKFLKDGSFRSSELDQVVERTYRKVDRFRSQLDQRDRYAQWVSVVCRNTYMNFVTRRRYVVDLESVEHPAERPPDPDADVNAGAIHMALLNAIADLPEFLQTTARLRFVENLTYEEISRLTGKRVPTVRSYIHKICRRLRTDAQLRHWAGRVLGGD
ncbi:MAG: sigma-70 family RNA polymerase sigma factor [Rhodothermales bacterium]|nr:sigma-70 family RNA polymerase sigma factor [Rhodothermales bacterium]